MIQLPERIDRLEELAYDLWWSWNRRRGTCSARSTTRCGALTAHNPVRMLKVIPDETLLRAAANPEWLALYDRAIARLDAARAAQNTWCEREVPEVAGKSIAYFSAEFALHQSLPIYAGGLGVLAGDHCKEASDLGVPLIGVGFMYPQGYFHQSLTADGWQQEIYEKLNWTDAPIEPAITPDGKPCVTAVPLGNRTVLVAVWRVRVGRVKLYLLDTDLEENAPWDRELSARLYGGDRETRVQQEIILGIGGVRVLKAMGSEPAVYHLNEGHAAFVVLQRIRDLCEKGWTFDAALEEVRRTTVFTTHTPVAAGHDAFPFQLVETHLAGAWGDLGAYRERFLALGAYDNGGGPMFNMTALALRTAARSTASASCTAKSRSRCGSRSGRARRTSELPVKSLTNGVHVPTWMSSEIDAAAREATSAPTGSSVTTTRRSPIACCRFPTRSCGRRARRCATSSSTSSASARASAGRTENVGAARVVAAGTMFDSEHADDRLRAPLHRLQATRADLLRPRSPRAHPQRAGTRRCRSCSPARRTRPTTSASITCSGSTSARSTRSSAGASRSSTTTTCTSRTSSCRAATSG